MPRRWLQKNLPTHKQLHEQLGMDIDDSRETSGAMLWLKNKLADTMLWHLNRRSVAGAVALGLFIAWLPIPMQMLIAALLATVLRVHVPVSVVLVWFSNPITFPALLYAAWYTGSTILGTGIVATPLSMSITDLFAAAAEDWHIILFGSVFCGTVFAVVGFFATNVVWRFVAVKRWKNRLSKSTVATRF